MADQSTLPDSIPASPADDRPRLYRRRFVSEMPDKGLFVIIAMAGFASIFTAKIWWDINPDYVAGLAVGLMLVYGVVAYRLPAVQLRVDRLGDNFYYLGFIYTLASLSAALVELRAGTPIEELIGSFGIALFSTIVGVAGRVMFAQMRSEIDEVEAEVRRDLLHTSAELRAQLALTLREFKMLHTAMTQTGSEIFEHSIKAGDAQVTEIVKVGEAVREQIKQIASVTTKDTKKMESILGRLDTAVAGFADKVSAIELPSRRLEEQILRLTEEINAMLEAVRRARQERKRRRRFFGR